MSNELITKEQQAVAITDTMHDLGVSAQDLVIPKVLLMQNTSEMVGDDKAKLGDIVNSQTLEVMGGLNAPVEIIPLKLYKTWRVYDLSSNQPKFLRQEPVTAANEKLPWEDRENGQPIRRDLCMNFFILLMKDVEHNEAFPLVVSFKRTSMQAGKQLATHLFKMAAIGRKPFSQTVQLRVNKQKKDTNVYTVFEIGKGKELSAEHKAEAEKWLTMLATMSYKVDEDVEREESHSQPAAPSKPAVVVGGESEDIPF